VRHGGFLVEQVSKKIMSANIEMLVILAIGLGLTCLAVLAMLRWIEAADKRMVERDTCKKCGWSKSVHPSNHKPK